MATTISIPDQIQVVGEPGSFYTLVSLDTLGPHASVLRNSRIIVEEQGTEEKLEEQSDEEGDILVCGKCKSQYSDVEVFLHHKKSCKRRGVPGVTGGEEIYYAVEQGPELAQLYLPSELVSLEEPNQQLVFQAKVDPPDKLLEDVEEDPTSDNINAIEVEESVETSADVPALSGDKQTASKDPKSKKLFCSYCHKGFNKIFDLTQHTRSHTGEKPYQCIICGRGFAQKSNVKKHMATHKVWPKGHRTLPKDVAVVSGEEHESEQVEVVRSIEATQVSTDNTEKISVTNCYECPYCTVTSTTYPTFKTHLRQHQTEKCFRCIAPNCSQMFQDLELFVEHTAEHKDRQFRCHICSSKFTDLPTLNLHSYSHLTDEQTREKQVFQCSKCKNKYMSAEALDHHLETTPHSFTCEVCDKEFTAERFLRKHLVITHSKGVFQCEVCNKKLKNEHYLKSHLLIHTGEMPFECKVCGTKFNRKDKLKRHEQTHEVSRKYKCPFKDHLNCTKEFHRFDKLKLHIMTHGNIKPFKCDVCSNGFSRKEHLNSHMQKVHLGGKAQFECKTCGDRFDSANLVTAHRKEKHTKAPAALKESDEAQPSQFAAKELPISCETSLLQGSDHFDLKYSEYRLPDHFEDGPPEEGKQASARLTLESSFPKTAQESTSQYGEKNEFLVQSAVGSAASQAMEILYSEGGHSILLPDAETYQINV